MPLGVFSAGIYAQLDRRPRRRLQAVARRLYHYFDSKEAILFAILDAHIREMIQHVETAVAAGGSTLTQFQNVIRAIVEVNAKSPHEQRVLIHDLSFLTRTSSRSSRILSVISSISSPAFWSGSTPRAGSSSAPRRSIR